MANCAWAAYLVSGVDERGPDNCVCRLMLITLRWTHDPQLSVELLWLWHSLQTLRRKEHVQLQHKDLKQPGYLIYF